MAANKIEKVKIFYSYSHYDEDLREKLEINLARLKRDGLIDEWFDRKIDAGTEFDEDIDKNMSNSHIIMFLFSPNFIDSDACDKEIEKSLLLKKKNDTVLIPLILRPCTWKDDSRINNFLAVPKDGKPITMWDNEDEAWLDVYEKVKVVVNKINNNFNPQINSNFQEELNRNPLFEYSLDKIFVYPDLESDDTSGDIDLSKTVNSDVLCNLNKLQHNKILIKGSDQSGKSSLCNILFLHYIDNNNFPIIISGTDLNKNFNINKIINKKYKDQYVVRRAYNGIPKDQKILIIDDIDKGSFQEDKLQELIEKVENEFKFIIITIDKIVTMSTGISKNAFDFPNFACFTIKQFGYKLRESLLKKCIEIDKGELFDYNNNDHLRILDKDTQHFESIIRTNLVPSFPIFLLSIYNIIEITTPRDLSKTSYGHCYQAITTMNLGRVGVKPEDIHAYFNFLSELSYKMFSLEKEKLLSEEFKEFISDYKNKFNYSKKMLENLINAKIIIKNSNGYEFGYRYIYYYFVAKYISDNISNSEIKAVIDKLSSELHNERSANIIIFITHHTKDKYVLKNILVNTMCVFDDHQEATLDIEETKSISDFIKDLPKNIIPDQDPQIAREEKLEKADLKENNEGKEFDKEDQENDLFIDITKSFRSMEIIGQILKNQYGSLEKENLVELFAQGQNIGLRMLNNFISFISKDKKSLIHFFQSKIDEIVNHKNTKKELSESDIKKISKFIFSFISYQIIFSILYKIAHSLGYDKLIETADSVANNTNTEASQLINFSIHTWYLKKLDIQNIKDMHKKYSNNKLVLGLMVDIIIQYLYMHKVDYKQKQQLNKILNIPIASQLTAQKAVENK